MSDTLALINRAVEILRGKGFEDTHRDDAAESYICTRAQASGRMQCGDVLNFSKRLKSGLVLLTSILVIKGEPCRIVGYECDSDDGFVLNPPNRSVQDFLSELGDKEVEEYFSEIARKFTPTKPSTTIVYGLRR
jgi:hypothetical protein